MKCQRCEREFNVFELHYGLCDSCLFEGMKGERTNVYHKKVEQTSGKDNCDARKDDGGECSKVSTSLEAQQERTK